MRFRPSLFAVLILAPLAPAQQSSDVAAALKPFVDSHSLAGAVTVVADKSKTLAVGTAGYADVGAKTPMRPDALFWIASMSKPITGAAVMVLVDEGKIDLDAPVAKYLPEFENLWVTDEANPDRVPLKRPKRAVTLRDCLSHTSGLPFKSALEAPTIDVLPLKDAVRSYTALPLVSEPGTKYLYSNAGINTAGRVVEVVSGMPFETFLEKRLFAPLGMTDTTFQPSAEQAARLAKSYKPNAAKDGLEVTPITYLKAPVTDTAGRYPVPGGGLFSTAADVAKFGQMVLNGGELNGKRVLSEKAVKEMTKRQTPEAVGTSYGLGWAVAKDGFGHGGAYATNLTVDPAKGRVYVYMVQHAGFPGNGKDALGAFKKAADAAFP